MEQTAAWTGTLSRVPVSEIFSRLSREKRSGTLSLWGTSRVEISLSSGGLDWAETKEEGSRFADFLLGKGLIQGLDLEEMRASSGALSRETFANRLIEKGLLSRHVLEGELSAYSLDVVSGLIAWNDGKFSFEDRPPGASGEAVLQTPLSAIVVEGIRKMPADFPFADRLGDLSLPARAIQDLSGASGGLTLTPEEAYLCSLCDGTISMKDILRMGRSQSKSAQILYSLLASGLVEVPAPSAGAEAPSREGERTPQEPASFAFDMVVPREGVDEKTRLEIARRSYLEARKLIELKDFYGAIVLLNESVRLSPQNSEYRYRLAGALAKNPLWRERALLQYAEAFRLDSVRQELLRDYVELLADCRRFPEAQGIARILVEKYPDELRNKLLLARCDNGVAELSRGGESSAGKAESTAEEPEAQRSLLSKLFRRGEKPE